MSDGEADAETPSRGQVDPPLCEAERRRAANIARIKEAESILRVSTLCDLLLSTMELVYTGLTRLHISAGPVE